MEKESFLHSNNWVEVRLSSPISSDYKMADQRDFMQFAKVSDSLVNADGAKDIIRLFEQEEVTGSDAIKFLIGNKQGLSILRATIDNALGREVFHADRVAVFVNTNSYSAKVVLWKDNIFNLKVRHNVTRVEVISY